jgi:hypothetical protein
MIKNLFKVVFIVLPFSLLSQTSSNKTTFVFPKKATINVSDIKEDYYINNQCIEKPMPGGIPQKTSELNWNGNGAANKTASPSGTLTPIFLGKNFIGNPYNNATPNDNDLAISNNCKIVSVSNCIIYFHDCVVDSAKGTLSLSAFAAPLGTFSQAFDPKVTYDPVEDRFVLVFLNGFAPSTSSIVVAFSQTNNPKGAWNFYTLPGNPFNNNLWSDYPMISLSQKELFITVNLIIPSMPWQTGFAETLIWQINKSKGYAGQPLTTQLHNNIKYSGNNVRNICPVKGGSTLYGPQQFFLSNKNFGVNTDSVFVIDISDTANAPGQALTVKLTYANKKYSLANDARQVSPNTFATNDSRVLGAFEENNKIQYVHNTKDSASGFCAVYHGIIDGYATSTPTVTGYVINDPILDLGYPNISYIGNGASDHTSIISMDHTAPTVSAGISAVKSDAMGNYSARLNIKNGVSYVDVLSGTQERWGDYSGSQRKYNETGKVWMNGYYGYILGGGRKHATWIAEIGLNPIITEIPESKTAENSIGAFPNPFTNSVSVNFENAEGDNIDFVLYDVNGREIKVLMKEYIKPGKQQFSFSMEPLPAGVYFLKIASAKKTYATQKLIRE